MNPIEAATKITIAALERGMFHVTRADTVKSATSQAETISAFYEAVYAAISSSAANQAIEGGKDWSV